MISLTDNITSVPQIGKKRAELYNKLGVYTVGDLLTFFPRDHTDMTEITSVADAPYDEPCTVQVTVTGKMAAQRIRSGLILYKAVAEDESDNMSIVFYNNRFAFDALEEGGTYRLYGKMSGNMVRREMNSPLVVTDGMPLIRPKYHLTEGLTAPMVMTNISYLLKCFNERIDDPMPDMVRSRFELTTEEYALKNIHFPESMHALEISRRRLSFDELVINQAAMRLLKGANSVTTGCVMKEVPIEDYEAALPFELTAAQKRACADIFADMKKDTPMNRLVQGDVGSGKTAVAAAACYMAYKNGYQSALMAPTEILAVQHCETLKKFLSPLGIEVGLLTGSMTQKQKNEIKSKLMSGELMVVTGTHALISDSTEFLSLGLIITDEQHRFGVEQRKLLAGKGMHPHKLVMSATPIPRTLALIMYGDLDISVINELPKGRQKIETYAVTGKLRDRALGFVKRELDSGHQAYIVCPMIDDDPESEIQNVESYMERLKESVLGGYPTGLLHGRLPAAEKDQIMTEFKNGELKILVSTTVIEVGVDVPNATVIMIESSERFGLAQLHQLRGRVGRGQDRSYCILLTDNATDEVRSRLRIMADTSDGFAIAEEDLKMRGAGEFFGVRQSGFAPFKIADLSDRELLSETSSAVTMIMEKCPDLSEFPLLRERAQALIDRNGAEGMN
ncbi:MAG: ATP-dependent DNA helicase RecG [Oscillospiraceae bacterium]|nr:ATP-dependent DNA helicase RecG [Oscillospiraceae bacterium]